MATVSSYLESFSGNFKAALILWPFLSCLLTLPILAYLYHRDGRLRLVPALSAYVSVLYIAGLGCFTLYPLPSGTEGPGITYGIPPQLDPLNFIYDIQRDGLKAVFQTLFNIVLFLPLGFIAKRFLRLGIVPSALLSLAATALIETAQLTGLFGIYPFAYRTFEVDDLITNTLGGILGWLIGRALEKIGIASGADDEDGVALNRHPGFIHRCVSLWIDYVLMFLALMVSWTFLSLCAGTIFSDMIRDAGLGLFQINGIIYSVCAIAVFFIMEGVIPWLHAGSTLGGMFTHMTVESKERNLPHRILFYVLRSSVLIASFMLPIAIIPVLAIFYIAARKMPYDYLP